MKEEEIAHMTFAFLKFPFMYNCTLGALIQVNFL